MIVDLGNIFEDLAILGPSFGYKPESAKTI